MTPTIAVEPDPPPPPHSSCSVGDGIAVAAFCLGCCWVIVTLIKHGRVRPPTEHDDA